MKIEEIIERIIIKQYWKKVLRNLSRRIATPTRA